MIPKKIDLVQCSVRLFSPDYEQIIEKAAKEDRDTSYIVRTIVHEWFENNKKNKEVKDEQHPN